MAHMLRVTQTGSVIGRTQDQRAAVRTLGLRRIRHTVIQPDRPEIRGMLRKVAHLVTFEEITAAEAEAFRAALEASSAPGVVPDGPRAKHVARDAWRGAEDVRRAAHSARTASAAVGTTTASGDAAEVTDGDSAEATAKTSAAKKAPVKRSAANKAAAKKSAAKKAATQKSTTKKSEG
jgi:large subunit ribosomal protein L30